MLKIKKTISIFSNDNRVGLDKNLTPHSAKFNKLTVEISYYRIYLKSPI